VLEGSHDDLLKQMKPKGRYNIRIAEKHKLKVEWGTSDAQVAALAELYATTAKRTGFVGRDATYFARLVTAVREAKLGEIIVVTHQEEILSAGLVTFYGGVASYLYGGSGGDRSLMAPYLMHWEAMKRAKQEGCAIYDLLAIAPLGKEDHVHAGLTRFKTQFGGQSVRMLGSWDLVHNRFWYTIYAFAQKRRRRAL
jgi:lipid II:glycine glycyltransferase (peptidoglycan interpeptide bridge formation enzyme)